MAMANVPGDPRRCTIVITAHGRQRFLPRVTSYYADFGSDIVIADSSPEPAPASYVCAPRARYIHAPGMLYYEKMRQAYASIDTPYVVECPDDDFVLTNAILEAVAILDHDEQAVCVAGRTVHISGRRARLSADGSWILQAQNIAFNRPELCLLRRLTATMRYFTAYNHCVYRRNVLLRAFELVTANKHLWPVRFFDKILAYVTVCSGYLLFVSRPMCLRDETRLMDEATPYPEALERNVEFSALPGRLRDGDPLAEMLAKVMPGADMMVLEKFNQKLFTRAFGRGYTGSAAPWLGAKYPVALAPAYQDEVSQALEVVRRYRRLGDWLGGVYLHVREMLGLWRRRIMSLAVS